jgi:hypothetical protein
MTFTNRMGPLHNSGSQIYVPYFYIPYNFNNILTNESHENKNN